MFQKKTKRVLSLATALALVCTGISLPDSNVAKAAKKAKLKTKKISLKVGKKKKIAISGKVKKAKYTFKSSKKAVASVSKSGVVTAKKKGNAVITVKEKKKKKTKVIGKVIWLVVLSVLEGLIALPRSMIYGQIFRLFVFYHFLFTRKRKWRKEKRA